MVRGVKVEVSHKSRVCNLYRNILKETRNWKPDFDQWLEEAWEHRQQFNKHMHETNPQKIEALVQNAEKELKRRRHPDPYICTLSYLKFSLNN